MGHRECRSESLFLKGTELHFSGQFVELFHLLSRPTLSIGDLTGTSFTEFLSLGLVYPSALAGEPIPVRLVAVLDVDHKVCESACVTEYMISKT